MSELRVARTLARTSAEGPGVRYAVWVQGCTIRCDGCFNPHLWAVTGGTPTDPVDLATEVAATSGIEGVTLLGGEPFEQAPALGEFAALVQAAGLTVMTFTGLLAEDLRERAAHDDGTRLLLDHTDLLVDGPYVADDPDLARPWVGSTNQRFHFLTDRYAHLADQLTSLPDRVEVRIARNGEVSVNGWASVDQLDELLGEATGHSPRRGRVR